MSKFHNITVKLATGIGSILPDELYLKIRYFFTFGHRLNLKNPRSFNEKIQWIKLYFRRDEMHTMVDKYEVRKHIEERIGSDYLVPILGVWKNFDDIDFNTLPNKFVLKCTHDSGSVFVCKDKKYLDINYLRTYFNEKIESKEFYLAGREWVYKDLEPRIIAEELLEDISGDLLDYKFFTFNGVVKCMKIDYDRFSDHKANYYDRNMEFLPFRESLFKNDVNRKFVKPKNYYKMVELAEKLSEGYPFMRVDFYNVNNEKIYFGEITFFPACGFEKFDPEEWDYRMGDWIVLPN